MRNHNDCKEKLMIQKIEEHRHSKYEGKASFYDGWTDAQEVTSMKVCPVFRKNKIEEMNKTRFHENILC